MKQQESRVQATQLGPRGTAKSNKQSRQGEECGYKVEAGQESILDVVRRQENWKNRLEDINGDRTTKFLKELELEGKRPRGRPRRRWIGNLNKTTAQ